VQRGCPTLVCDDASEKNLGITNMRCLTSLTHGSRPASATGKIPRAVIPIPRLLLVAARGSILRRARASPPFALDGDIPGVCTPLAMFFHAASRSVRARASRRHGAGEATHSVRS